MTETDIKDSTLDDDVAARHLAAQRPSWVIAVIAGLLAGTLAILTGVFGAALHSAKQAPAPAAAEQTSMEVSNTVFSPSTIEMDLTNNTGKSVGVAQLFIQDQYTSFEGAESPMPAGATEHVVIDYPWIEGHPLALSFVLGDGSLFETELTAGAADEAGAAAPADKPTPNDVWCLVAITVIAVIAGIVFAVSAVRKTGADATRSVLGVSAGLLFATAIVAVYFALTNL